MIDITTLKESRTFDKIRFMAFEYGQHRVRIVGQPRGVWTHFLRGKATIECLGNDCPVCQNNKLLKSDAGTQKNVSGVNPASYRFYVNVLDRTLSVTGLIDGLSQTAAQTKAQAIEVDRAALEALEDGYHHVYNDGRHSGNFAIVPETLIFPDSADVTQGEPMRFTMELVEWQ